MPSRGRCGTLVVVRLVPATGVAMSGADREAGVRHVQHREMCCDEPARAHVHVEEVDGVFSFRLALHEWSGEEDEVLAAVSAWLRSFER